MKQQPKHIRRLSIVERDGQRGRFHGFQRFGSTYRMRVKVFGTGRWAYWPAPMKVARPYRYKRKPPSRIHITAKLRGISYVVQKKINHIRRKWKENEMSDSSIAWLTGPDGSKGRTWNPLAGCDPISPGCANCYAATMAARLHLMGQAKYQDTAIIKDRRAKWTGKIVLGDDTDIDAPLGWKKPRMIFVNSMSDLFHEKVPDHFIDRVFVTMWNAQWHTYQVLTKRIERAAEYLRRHDLPLRLARQAHAALQRREPEKAAAMSVTDFVDEFRFPLRNLLIGPSIENQTMADQRLPHVEAISRLGWRTMISAEPLLGAVDLNLRQYRDCIDWLVVGGESGPHCRECHIDWITSIVNQCYAAGVRVFVKQLGRRVLIRNDRFQAWPNEGDGLRTPPHWRPNHQGEDVEVRLINPKGEAMDEWPKALRIRQAPRPMKDATR